MKPHVFEQGPPIYAIQPAWRRAAAIRSTRVSTPGHPDFLAPIASMIADLRREMCAPAQIVIYPRGENVGPDGVRIFVDATTGLKCSQDFRDWLQARQHSGLNLPIVDYAHGGEDEAIAGDVVDVSYDPCRGVLAAIDWRPWAEQEILKGTCDSFSPMCKCSDDSSPLEWNIDGLKHNVGGLMRRTMTCGIPLLQGSVKPITKLEDFVFRACHFKRLLRESGFGAAAKTALAERMPRSYAAFNRFTELESEFGPDFYMRA